MRAAAARLAKTTGASGRPGKSTRRYWPRPKAVKAVAATDVTMVSKIIGKVQVGPRTLTRPG